MEKILKSFDKEKTKFDSCAKSFESLLSSLLLNNGISIHSLESRVKERDSLEKKLVKKAKYRNIEEITDVVGIRIITHYADDVDKVAEIVEREFLVDKENSINKASSLEPDRFGYLSLHYIISLDDNRSALFEHSTYKNTKVEIQIRTILQHAWAEIEHDIGYKSNIGLPDIIRRQFSRLAGLLEIADNEFINIKNQIEIHKSKVNSEFNSGEQDILIDQFSLSEYFDKSKQLHSLEKAMVEESGVHFTPTITGKDMVVTLKGLQFFQIKKTNELNEFIEQNHSLGVARTKAFAHNFAEYTSRTPIPREYVILYLLHAVVAMKDDRDIERDFSEKVMINVPEGEFEGFFSHIRKAIKRSN